MADTPRSFARKSIRATGKPTSLMDEPPNLKGVWQAHVVTLFPECFPGVLGASLTGKALQEGLWQLHTHDLCAHGVGKHRNVDDTPAGGGAGMVLRADVVAEAVRAARGPAQGPTKGPTKGPILYMSPRGRPFDQAMARDFARQDGLTILCGRFEGVDERAIEALEMIEVSVGDFVMTGGEIAAQAVLDATVRLIPGVLGNAASTEEESHANGLLEHPQYTRPATWEGRAIPDVLMSGHHGDIAKWRRAQSEALTQTRRPDLWARWKDSPK